MIPVTLPMGSRTLLLRATVTGPLLESAGRTTLSVIAIALGVALGMAIHLVNRSAADEVSLAARSLFGLADLVVEGDGNGFDESLYPRIANVRGVQLASPVVEVEARLVGRRGTMKALGVDAFRASRMQPSITLERGGSEQGFFDPDAVYLSAAAARELGLEAGDQLRLQVGLGPVPLRIAGVLPGAAYREPLIVFDIATAQWRLDRLGRLDRVELRLAPGARPQDVRAELRSLLPAGVDVETPGAETDEALRLSRAYRANLTALALVALFTGAFLVYATQSLSVVRRRKELALLNALGLTAAEQLRAILLGAALLGGAGAALGIVLGVLVADFGMRAFGADLGAGYFRGVAPRLDVHAGEYVFFFLLGTGTAVAASLRPAVHAASVPASIALRAGDASITSVHGAGGFGVALLSAASLVVLLPPVGGLPLPGYFSIALILLGAVFCTPALTRAIFHLLPGEGPAPYRVAVGHLSGTAPQATVSIAAILVSFSLMVAMAIMVTSFRLSLDRWLGKILPADLYVRVGYTGQSAWLDPGTIERLRNIPGVERLETNRFAEVLLTPGRAPVTLIARPIAVANAAEVLWLESALETPVTERATPAWLSESAADLHGLGPGSSFTLVLGDRAAQFVVQGIWRDYERQNGAVVIDRDAYVRLSGDTRANTAWMWLEPDASLEQVIAEARKRLPLDADYDLRLPGEIRALSLRIFDRTFAVTYLLEVIAVLIGLFGISASTSAQVLARRAEFGMLRHIGFTRSQVARLLALEGAALGTIGVLTGLVVGALVSLILIYVVNRQSFHWSMDLYFPGRLLVVLSTVLIAAAAVTAAWSGRRAMTGDVVQAVKEDW